MKRLLVVWHTQLGGTAQMAMSAIAGAREAGEVEVLALRAHAAGIGHVLDADAYLFGCSENFGGVAGAFKDFLERVYYPCEHRLQGRAWSAFVCAGTDGAGAMRGLERIATGLKLRKVHPGIVHCSGEVAMRQRVPDAMLAQCRELGGTLAAGLAAGLW